MDIYVFKINLTAVDIAGKTSDEILDPEYARILTSRNQELLKNPGVLTYSDTISLKGKIRHNVTIQKSTFTTQDGVTAGIIGLILSNREVLKK